MKQQLKIEYLAADELKPYENNPRTHSKDQVEQIAASMEAFGWTNPILIDEENGIIAGHGRLEAAKVAKIDPIPCIRLKGLDEAQRRALVIADNKLALNAGWDMALLREEISMLDMGAFDLNLLGFTPFEMDDLMKSFEPASEDDQGGLDQVKEKQPVICPECAHEFIPKN